MRRNYSARDFFIVFYAIIFLLVSTLFFSQLIRHTKKHNEQVQELNSYIMSTISENTHKFILNSDKAASSFVLDTPVSEILNIKTLSKYHSSRATYSILQEISPYTDHYNLSFMYIYFPKSDSFFCSKGIFDSKTFFTIFLSESGTTYEKWIEIFRKTPASKHFYTAILSNTGQEPKKLVFFNSDFSLKNSKLIIGCGKYTEDILTVSKSVEWQEQYCVSIYNDKNDLSFTNSPHSPTSSLITDTNTYIINASNITVETSVPKEAITKNYKHFSVMSVLITTMYVLLFFLLLTFLYKKSITPVSRIFNMFSLDISKSNYKKLYELIETTKKESEENKQSVLLTEFLSGLFHSNNPQSYINNLAESGIFLSGKYFSVTIFYVYDNLNFSNTEQISESLDDSQNAHFIIKNVFGNLLFDMQDECKIIYMDGFYVCLVNSVDGSNFHLNNLISTYQNGISVISQNFGIDMISVTTKFVDSISLLPSKYQDATHKLLSMVFFNRKGISILDNGEEFLESSYTLSQEQLKIIEAAFLLKDVETIRSFSANILNKLSHATSASFNHTKVLLIDYATCFLRCADANSTKFEHIYIEIFRLSNIDETRDWLFNFTEKICNEYIITSSIPKPIKDSVLDYISENFQDHNLNVDTIANSLGYSSSYLSQTFKDSYNKSILEVIHLKRIDFAKALIKSTQMSINEISILSGFSNIRTFNRVFKSLEGVTPTNYQKNNT